MDDLCCVESFCWEIDVIKLLFLSAKMIHARQLFMDLYGINELFDTHS